MQDMHGYQIAEVIESHFGDSVHVKKPTMYDTLKKLEAEGLVDSREEQEGNRPLRTVYSMTEEGDAEFLRLLRESVTEYTPPHAFGDVGLLFLDVLPASEAAQLLSERRDTLTVDSGSQPDTDPHDGAMALAADRLAHHVRAEVEWLDDTLARLQVTTDGDQDE
jgi:DNA-binding PadR family transcriptional regulator